MYLFFGIFFLILLLFFVINHWRKKKIIKKVCSMSCEQKCEVINGLVEPFGYAYMDTQDLFTTRMDAWQKKFGYCRLYDDTAYHFHLIFDSLPVYFNYRGRTWLIELWKGQYGITTGGEIGVYYAGTILRPEEINNTLFKGVSEEDMLSFSFQLFQPDRPTSCMCARHWWLTAFRLGSFCRPCQLSMRASITFPCREMANAFLQGLYSIGYSPCDICRCCNKITFTFNNGILPCRRFCRIRSAIAQWMNHFWCRVFLFVSRPFCLSLDRVLYLYYYLPFAFRRAFRIRRYKKYKRKRRYS